jgi:glycosyltransferase involved in cell wall biosynthesis
MIILIISLDNNPQFLGGIKRVTSILGKEWILKGHDVFYITFCTSTIRNNNIDGIPQFFFPDIKEINSEINRQFLKSFISEHHIGFVLNPHVEDRDLTRLSFASKSCDGVRLISALHFSPTHSIDITARSFFNSYYLGHDIKKWMRNLVLSLRFELFKKREIESNTKRWYKEVIECSDKFVVLSKEFLPFFGNLGEKIASINNPAIYVKTDEPFNKENYVVWCGRLDVNGQKQVLAMLRIWKRMERTNKDWKLYILGSGDISLINSYKSKYKIKGIEVVGFCNPFDYYKKAKIVAMTSSTEGWGMVLVEGQSCGCVPIAFGSYASITDIISNDENGIIIKAFDESEYVRMLTELMNNDEKWQYMSDKARKSIRRFDAELIAQKWLELFRSL